MELSLGVVADFFKYAIHRKAYCEVLVFGVFMYL
jgi:hypothetical protein